MARRQNEGRVQVDTPRSQRGGPNLQATSRAADTWWRPDAAPRSNNALKLAESLSQLEPGLMRAFQVESQHFASAEETRAVKAINGMTFEESRDAVSNGQIRESESPWFNAAFEKQFGIRMAGWRKRRMSDAYENEFDKEQGNIDEFIDSQTSEDQNLIDSKFFLAGYQDNMGNFGEKLRNNHADWLNTERKKSTVQGFYDVIADVASTKIGEGASPQEVHEAVRGQYAPHRQMFGIQPRELDDAVVALAENLAMEGNTEYVTALLDGERVGDDGQSLGAISSKLGQHKKVFTIKATAAKFDLEQKQKANLDNRIELMLKAKDGKLSPEDMVKAKQMTQDELMSESAVLSLLSTNEGSIDRAQAKAVREQERAEARQARAQAKAERDADRVEARQLREEAAFDKFVSGAITEERIADEKAEAKAEKAADKAALKAERDADRAETRQLREEAAFGSFMADVSEQQRKADEKKAAAARDAMTAQWRTGFKNRALLETVQALQNGEEWSLEDFEGTDPTGKDIKVDRDAALKDGLPLYLEAIATKVKAKGGTEDDIVRAQSTVLSENGLTYEPWERAMNQGYATLTAMSFNKKPGAEKDTDLQIPNALTEGYRRWKQLSAINPAIRDMHIKDARAGEFYRSVDNAMQYITPGDEQGALLWSMKINSDPELKKNFSYNKTREQIGSAVKDVLAKPGLFSFSSSINKTDIETKLTRVASEIAGTGVSPDAAVEAAKNKLMETHTDIRGWAVDTSNMYVPGNISDLAALAAKNYSDKYAGKNFEDIDQDKLILMPHDKNSNVWVLTDVSAGYPVPVRNWRTDGLFGRSDLLRMGAENEFKKGQERIKGANERLEQKAPKGRERPSLIPTFNSLRNLMKPE